MCGFITLTEIWLLCTWVPVNFAVVLIQLFHIMKRQVLLSAKITLPTLHTFPAAAVQTEAFGSSQIADVCNRGMEQISGPANLSEL